MDKPHFYMRRYPINGVAQSEIDIEETYAGLIVTSIDGLGKLGKMKSIYKESYPETEVPRVYISDTNVRDNVDVTITCLFVGDSRRASYDSFVSYITGHKLYFRETARNRTISLLQEEEIAPSEDILKGSNPYIEVPFKFTALSGSSISN